MDYLMLEFSNNAYNFPDNLLIKNGSFTCSAGCSIPFGIVSCYIYLLNFVLIIFFLIKGTTCLTWNLEGMFIHSYAVATAIFSTCFRGTQVVVVSFKGMFHSKVEISCI